MSKLPKVSDSDLVLGQINALKNYLLGRTLTIVDGCIADLEQRKAVKDLVREAMWSQEYFSKTIQNIVEGKPPYENNINNMDLQTGTSPTWSSNLPSID